MSNKEKSPLCGIIMTVLFALTAAITLYSLLGFIGASKFAFVGGDEYWAYANQFNLPTVDPNRVFGTHRDYNGELVWSAELLFYTIKDFLFKISLLCLIAFCILIIIKKDKKHKAVSLSLTAFAALQLIAYALQIIVIIRLFIKHSIPFREWTYHLYHIGFSSSYLWECLWRMLISTILLLYALKSFIPTINGFLGGSAKQTIFNVCAVIFLLSFAFLPSTNLHNAAFSYEPDFSLHLPFYVATLWSWSQTAIFIWFIKE